MKKLLLFCLVLFAEASADYVVVGGYGSTGEGSDAPQYFLADQFSIGKSNPSAVTFPPNNRGQILAVAIDSLRGTVVYVGQDQNNVPLIFKGSVVSSSAISIPSAIGNGEFTTVAIDSDGNAIIGGYGVSPSPAVPLIYRLPLGGKEISRISLPNGNEGQIFSIAIGPNNTAILGGYNTTGNIPLVWVLPSGANQAIPLSLNDPSTVNGFINSIAVGPDGTAILGGTNTTVGDGEGLIYSLSPGSLAANPISVPDSNDGGIINTVAIGSDGTAILGGSVGTTTTLPLIYRVLPGSGSATLLANSNNNEGTILSVAIASDGTAILGGADGTTLLPLIYKLSQGATQATSAQLPNALGGTVLSVVIGSQDVAVLAGSYFDSQQTLLLTLPITDHIASSLSTSQSVGDISIIGAIYSYDGLYDIRRLRPYYYLQQNTTITELNQAGFP